MKAFSIDKNGINGLSKRFDVDYPDTGHDDTQSFEQDSFWFKHRNNVILKFLGRTPGIKGFVDIGGGTGLQAKFINDSNPNLKVGLVEPGYAGCMSAKKKGVQHVYNCMFEDFDFREFQTGAVGLFDVIEHIENDADFLRRLSAKLEVGTQILITVPAYSWLWSDVDDYGHHYRRYNLFMINQLASKAGLRMVDASHFFSFLVPLTYFFRVLPYKLKGGRSREEILEAENNQHKPSRVVSRCLAMLCNMEMKLFKTGKLNFGASIVANFEVV
jgi:2-polyprenyl-3-methyl-5-hydroxy-6-metoxy-1,4-benzoquinol methylase